MSLTPDAIRRQTFQSLADSFDVLVIGGGATGLGVALDAITRGYKTALVDAGDYAQATSSRSTKLVHGGVRYLATGQIHLVREALHERAVMQRNAPHLVHPLPTLLPTHHLWGLPWFGAGLVTYDLLSGSSSMGPTRILSPIQAAERVPGIARTNLTGGILYHDAQFNDARYALALARAAIDHGATLLNYVRCTGFLHASGPDSQLTGATLLDTETSESVQISAKAIINATGIFTDQTRSLDQPTRPPLLSVSRGSHIVVPARFLGGNTAVMVPKTEDGRVIFAIPWQGIVLIGTTDIPADASLMEPGFEQDEIDYLLRHIAPYFSTPISRDDILSVYSGLRPLVTGKENKTSKLSREHHIDSSNSGLITVAGGKWTTYRRMAEDTLNFAIRTGLLPPKSCVSSDIPLHAAVEPYGPDPYLAEYGTDAPDILAMSVIDPHLATLIDPALPYSMAMVAYAVRQEYARSLDDVLARRTRSLLLDARATIRAAEGVAMLMATELGRDSAWIRQQVDSFTLMANTHYLP